MNGRSSENSSRLLLAWCVAATIAALVFGGLWNAERNRKPVEVVREVVKEIPVEVIKEVPKLVPAQKAPTKQRSPLTVTNELIRELLIGVTNQVTRTVTNETPVEVTEEMEVEAELSELEEFYIEMGEEYLAAPELTEDKLLAEAGPFKIVINISRELLTSVPLRRVRSRIDQVLRRHQIPQDDKSNTYLCFDVNGVWNETETLLSYSTRCYVVEPVVVERETGLFRAHGSIWLDGVAGSVTKAQVEPALLLCAEQHLETFATAYKRANPVGKSP